MDEKLKNLIECAIVVAFWRDDDIYNEDGALATTDIDAIISLEESIQDLFDMDSDELAKSPMFKSLIGAAAKIKVN